MALMLRVFTRKEKKKRNKKKKELEEKFVVNRCLLPWFDDSIMCICICLNIY